MHLAKALLADTPAVTGRCPTDGLRPCDWLASSWSVGAYVVADPVLVLAC